MGKLRSLMRLRRADLNGPGIVRRRRGRGWEYLDEDGVRIDDRETVERIRELAIPPAWKDVWICPYPNGHIQAVGTDAAGRKQYRYHQRWRERRDAMKFEKMTDFARALPGLRDQAARDLRKRGYQRERVLAGAVRLLDRGFFRIGGEEYAEDNSSYGLATIRKSHVTLGDGCEIAFDYPAKSGKRHVRSVVDRSVYRVVEGLKKRRGGGHELLAYQVDDVWFDVKSDDINSYIKETTGGDFTAKDFRTWTGTVLAAVALAVSGPVATLQGGAQARDDARDRGGGPLPRQHARGGARLVHRPARVRPLPVGRDDRRRAPRAGRRGRGRRARLPGRDRGGRPRPPRGRDEPGARTWPDPRRGSIARMAALALGDAAPAFRLPGVDGAEHGPDDYEGVPVAVVFSCCHCPYVVAWDGRLNAIAQDFKGRAGLVAVNSNHHAGDTFDAMVVRAAEEGFVFPFLRDDSQEVAAAYGAQRTPEVFLFDRDAPARLPRRAGLRPHGSRGRRAVAARRARSGARRGPAAGRGDPAGRLHREVGAGITRHASVALA